MTYLYPIEGTIFALHLNEIGIFDYQILLLNNILIFYII